MNNNIAPHRAIRLLAWWGRLLSLLLVTLVAISCGDDETVTPPAGTVTINITGGHSLDIGASVTLSAATVGATDSGYNWTSSSDAIATVDAAGAVTAVADGEATITATGADSGAKGEHVIVVLPDGTVTENPVVTISGDPWILTGSTGTLTAMTVGGTDSGYAWTSSDDTIATVDASGVVSGIHDGDVTITATGADTAVAGTLAIVITTDIPNYDKWVGSAHADKTAEPFNHWNGDTPPEIPTSCARCHSTPGYRDYIGADGTAFEVVDNPAPIGTVIECGACHNDAADTLTQVTFPSGVTIDGLGAEARCMTCHQGRSSSDDVDDAITAAAVSTDDEVSANLSFLNIHYYAAGATLNAGRVRGGYQYAGETYDWRFRHVPEKDTCIECHDQHSLQIRIDDCKGCHTAVTTVDSLKDVRMMASKNHDYDGDADITEGIYYEMIGVRDLLITAIQTYTSEQSLGDICYDSATYPYWFKDTDASGVCDGSEASFANGWDQWTARLLRATYNYQVASKDPGAFAHNGKYIIQLLHDSVADLNTVLTSTVDLTNAVRNDSGHFDGSGEPARHWDEDETVSSGCARCHGASEGFRFYLKYGVGEQELEQANGLDCATCHDNFEPNYDTAQISSVLFPSGISITLNSAGHPDNICATCHQGRESKATVDARIASNSFSFRNIHYLPAASVRYGTQVKVGYEYTSKTYASKFTFANHDQCINCHSPIATEHSFQPQDQVLCTTGGCHSGQNGGLVENIRLAHTTDYDGDAATTKLGDEIQAFAARLLAGMQTYATGTLSQALCYDGNSYPYFFKDTNSNGTCETTEAVGSNGFGPWDAELMKAAFNYQISQKEPGAWAHNFDYMGQLLYDSTEAMGGNLTGLTRP